MYFATPLHGFRHGYVILVSGSVNQAEPGYIVRSCEKENGYV